MEAASPKLWTVTRIAEHLRVPRHRVEYVVAARRIRPAERAGNARVFAGEQVRLIEAELARSSVPSSGGAT